MRWFASNREKTVAPPSHPDGGVRMSVALSSQTVKTDLRAVDKNEAIEELVDVLVRAGRLADYDAAVEAVHDRERLASTGIGNGVAVPHGKSANIAELAVALGISRRGVDFDSLDGKPAHVIVLLLARSDNPGPHVQALAEVARLMQAPDFVKRLTKANSPSEVLAMIRSEE
jgi:fructose-specific phosphotransferase system IIA component